MSSSREQGDTRKLQPKPAAASWAATPAKLIPSSLWPDDFFFSSLGSASRVLDVGCGVGALALHLAADGHRVDGADLSHDAIREARDMAQAQGLADRCHFEQCSATSLPYSTDTFDAAVIQAVLTTVPKEEDRRLILRAVCRVLKAGGILYLAEFAQTWHRADYRSRYLEGEAQTGEVGLFVARNQKDGQALYYAKHFCQREMVELLLQSGFEITRFRHAEFRTQSGNIIDGFQVIATPAQNGESAE